MPSTARRSATLAALAASLGLAATPVSAANMPLPRSVAAHPIEGGKALGHSRWDRHRHDDGIDAGDVIAGVVVLGAIAALAGVFDSGRDEPRRYPRDARYPPRGEERSGLKRAVDMCVAELERSGERVTEVDEASRDASGWLVSGLLSDGDSFSCRIGNDGRIRAIDRRGRYAAAAPAYDPASEDAQYSDSVYAQVRADQRNQGEEPRPAYPGGPFPGEEGYEDHATR